MSDHLLVVDDDPGLRELLADYLGRNGFQFYSSEMNVATLEHLMLESSLRNALPKGELLLFYQPLVSLESGRIVGVEALIRWRHPQIGMISPARFIPVAEDTGIISAIGDWVLFEACRQAMAWQTLPVEVVPVLPGTIPVLRWFAQERGFAGATHREA